MKLSLRHIFTLFFVFLSLNVVAQTKVELFNNTGKRLTVAYVKHAGSYKGWESQGWYSVEPYASRTINIGNYEGDIFLFAENNSGGKWGGGPYSFCVYGNAFTIRNSDEINCDRKETFSKGFSVRPGLNRYTFNP